MAAQRAQRTADTSAAFIVPLLSAAASVSAAAAAVGGVETSAGRAAPLPRGACVLKLPGDQDVDGEVRPPMRSLLQRDVVDERRRERRRRSVGWSWRSPDVAQVGGVGLQS